MKNKRTLNLGCLLMAASLITACSSTNQQQSSAHQQISSIEQTAEQAKWAKAIDTKNNFYQVDNKLYRAAQLSPADYPLLQQQGIKSIINLRFFDRNDDKIAFANRDIQLINTPLLTWAITPKQMAQVLHQIRQSQQQGAVLVHCYHGADRTGLTIAMYRVVFENWSLQQAKQEMIQGPYGFHSIWRNIENFFTEQNVAEIKKYLAELN